MSIATNQLTINCDGGSRGNPGNAACAFVVENQDGQELHRQSQFLGVTTNNQAEYRGFLLSVEWLKTQVISPNNTVAWRLDSKLVVEQLSRRWKIKEKSLTPVVMEIWQQLATLSCEFVILHVPREQNVRADELVNLELDAHA